MFKHLIQPINIGSMMIRNRMVQPAMGTNLAACDGTVSDPIVDYYAVRAKGGIGLIIVEACTIEPRGRSIPCQLELSSLRFIPELSRLVIAAHSGGAKIALQLAHCGGNATESICGSKPISPSGIGSALSQGEQPRSMTIDEIRELVKAYGLAAQRARMAGFDAVEVHGAHGYIPMQFLSGYTNRRTDEYGGSFQNRARFPLEVIRSIKEHAGIDFPLIYRLSAEEYAPGGVTIEEAIHFTRLATEAGIDAIHVSAGSHHSRIETFSKVMSGQETPEGKRLSEGVGGGIWVPPHYVPRGNLVSLAEDIKRNVSIPVIAVCGISPELAEEIIASGRADLVAMGRQIIADPEYPNKVTADKPGEIRRCVRCNECLSSVLSYRRIDCAVNATAGKEHEMFTKITPASNKRKVMIIGGGPAGMEAARIAALRGHVVTVYEKTNELGGLLRYAAVPEFKKDYRDFLAWQRSELDRRGVQVVTNVEVVPELVQSESPDAIIVASGSRPSKPVISGIEDPSIYSAIDILSGNIPKGKKIIVCGAGLVGTDVGMFLAESHNKQVTLVDMLPMVAPELDNRTRWVVQGRLAEDGIEVRINHCITCLSSSAVSCTYEGNDITLNGDAVVLALGFTNDLSLYDDLKRLSFEVFAVGDAVQVRKVINAVHDGFYTGQRI